MTVQRWSAVPLQPATTALDPESRRPADQPADWS